MAGLTHPSPNHGERRGRARPDLIVLHYTAMPSAEAALARLCDPQAEVSAHYLICTDGRLCHLVDEARRAWHAGAGAWGDVTDVNSRSIGIELANTGAQPFAETQMAALERLLEALMRRWAIRPERVIAHSDMAPGRKADPGPRFDWCRLARQGLSVWPRSDAREDGDLPGDLRRFGYPDAPPDVLLAAFRLRFRPWVTGPVTRADRVQARDLASRFPVDRHGATS